MDQARHRTTATKHDAQLWRHLLPQEEDQPYPPLVGEDTSSDVRRLRVDKELWDAFGEVVGDGGRSAALKNYMQWQIEHPDTPLPGQFRVPVKVRRKPGEGT